MFTLADRRNTKCEAIREAIGRRSKGAAPVHLVEVHREIQRSVDFNNRTIEGFASKRLWDSYNDVVLRGAFARTVRERFTDQDTSRIKVLRDHDWSAAVGLPVHMEETDEGLLTVSKIAKTSRGEELLTLANEGIVDGLSIGFFIPEGGAEWADFSDVQELNDMGYGKLQADPAWLPPRLISDVDLIEYSFVPFPAVDDARVEVRCAVRDDILRTLSRRWVGGARLSKAVANKAHATRDAHHIGPISKGARLAELLGDAIDSMVDDDTSRADIISSMATAAGISQSTVNEIINETITCPPVERLEGFARVLGVSASSLISAAEADGCSYESREMSERLFADQRIRSIEQRLGAAPSSPASREHQETTQDDAVIAALHRMYQGV